LEAVGETEREGDRLTPDNSPVGDLVTSDKILPLALILYLNDPEDEVEAWDGVGEGFLTL